MLSPEEIEFISQVEGDAPMGQLMRRYWMPFLLTGDLPDPDGEPVRVRLLGEDLVAFRDTSGRVGLIEKYCAHRCGDLWFGRNEENGLRCTYHGWKWDVEGRCMDMPSEPAESNFKDKVRVLAYAVEERAGVLWTYMGPSETKPALPEFEWARVPEKQRYVSWNYQENNFVQAIEGGIDTVHSIYLHSTMDSHRKLAEHQEQGRRQDNPAMRYRTRTNPPKLFAQDTDYGVMIGGQYRGDGEDYWRFNLFLDPFYSGPPGSPDSKLNHAFVPVDNHTTARWSFTWNLQRPIPAGQVAQLRRGSGVHSELIPGSHWPKRNMRNNYLINREEQRSLTFTGITGTGEQDYSVQEGMGVVQDRGKEHLGTSDMGIIAMRRRIMRLARELQEGFEPFSATHGDVYKVHPGEVVLPPDAAAGWAEDERIHEALAAKW